MSFQNFELKNIWLKCYFSGSYEYVGSQKIEVRSYSENFIFLRKQVFIDQLPLFECFPFIAPNFKLALSSVFRLRSSDLLISIPLNSW